MFSLISTFNPSYDICWYYNKHHPSYDICWYYNRHHHGKGPMDGIGGTVNNLVFRHVKSGKVVINTPEEVVHYADKFARV